jgi:hypothetical protein
MDRPQTQDIISNLFDDFVELSGDGRVGRDVCIRGGLASFSGQVCVVLGTFKGHGPQAMLDANYGMASPHGYRTAMRLMQIAERFGLPVVTLGMLHIYIYIYIYIFFFFMCIHFNICMYVYTYLYMCICIHIYLCMYACMYTSLYTYT